MFLATKDLREDRRATESVYRILCALAPQNAGRNKKNPPEKPEGSILDFLLLNLFSLHHERDRLFTVSFHITSILHSRGPPWSFFNNADRFFFNSITMTCQRSHITDIPLLVHHELYDGSISAFRCAGIGRYLGVCISFQVLAPFGFTTREPGFDLHFIKYLILV